jgi:hypothetical protein
MKITIELEHLEPHLIQFFESSESNKIKDALHHGYQIVNSPDYALHLHQNDQKTSEIIHNLKEELALQKKKNVEISQTCQENLLQQLSEQHQTFLHQEKLLQEQISNLHQTHMLERKEIENEVKKNSEAQIKRLEEKNEALHYEITQNLKENQAKMEQTHLNYQLELEKKQEKIDIHQSIHSNSSRKGQLGELRTGELLNQLFPSAEIKDTGHTPENGDFRIVIQGIQILYEHKNFQNNVPKRDILKFQRDIEISDCDGGIICSDSSGIANKNDLDLEIIGESQKPAIYLHHTLSNPQKIQVAVNLLVNILVNKVDLNTSTLTEIKDQVKECDSLMTIYQSNRKQISSLQDSNEKLLVHSRKIKYRLEHVIQELSNKETGKDAAPKKSKEKCEFCGKAYVNLENHYAKCEKKKIMNAEN